MKVLIFDTGTLITLSMNGFLYLLEEIKKTCDCKFLITKEVKYEVLDRPIGIKRFELGALRVGALIERGILELPNALEINESEMKKTTKELMETANHTVKIKGKYVDIVSEGEISCLALSKDLIKKGIENIIAIDERTTRVLVEKPENLTKLMTKKLKQRVDVVKGRLKGFENFKFIRSTELVYVAHKKGLLRIKGKRALGAALYATRFKGSAVSFEEIEEMKKL